MARDRDPALRRIERDTAIVCAVFAAVAWAASGRPAAAGVIGGALLVVASYWTIKASVDRWVSVSARAGPEANHSGTPPRISVWVVLQMVGRYALLAGIAYVMIARLRVHALSLLAGVSTIVVGAALEAGRALTGRRASP